MQTITKADEILASCTLECDCCSEFVTISSKGAVISLRGHMIEVLCSKCAGESFERSAVQAVTRKLAAEIGEVVLDAGNPFSEVALRLGE